MHKETSTSPPPPPHPPHTHTHTHTHTHECTHNLLPKFSPRMTTKSQQKCVLTTNNGLWLIYSIFLLRCWNVGKLFRPSLASQWLDAIILGTVLINNTYSFWSKMEGQVLDEKRSAFHIFHLSFCGSIHNHAFFVNLKKKRSRTFEWRVLLT